MTFHSPQKVFTKREAATNRRLSVFLLILFLGLSADYVDHFANNCVSRNSSPSPNTGNGAANMSFTFIVRHLSSGKTTNAPVPSSPCRPKLRKHPVFPRRPLSMSLYHIQIAFSILHRHFLRKFSVIRRPRSLAAGNGKGGGR